ncbi:MAG: hypothetical protein KZQ76_09010 [Candidatus Thiodiazotropha sp. (ex Epidulcina cf. delphinae)]|nr:hypothetical protein [Candidatus Thiodiazotropha sp. (ex Epidulcina cf. delphinae)]
MDKRIDDRYIRGLELCHEKYRDQDKVPYQAIAALLNERLPAEKRVEVERLSQAHKRDIHHCEVREQRAAAHIDASLLREAIGCCAPQLQVPLLQAWQAADSVERAARNIAKRIRTGSATEVLRPFSRLFDEVYANGAASPELRGQIWAVVEAVSRACVIPGSEYQPGKRQEVGTDQAWLLRIRLLVAQNLPINGLSSDKDRHLKDEDTHALITQGVSSAGDSLQRFWKLVGLLVERYDPGREAPPDPRTDRAAFQRYCGRLNAGLILDSETKALFFHLMTSPESDEVTDLLYQHLPGLMGFISHEIDGPTEGLLIDDEDLLGGWIARWLYRTGCLLNEDIPSQGTSQSTSAQEKNDMTTPATNQQSIKVTAGEGATVTLVTGQDRSSPTFHQRGIDPAQILPLLDQLLKATAQEPSPPTDLRREIRTLQTDIEAKNELPADFMTRLTAAIPDGLALGNQATTILNNIRQMWQIGFGA